MNKYHIRQIARRALIKRIKGGGGGFVVPVGDALYEMTNQMKHDHFTKIGDYVEYMADKYKLFGNKEWQQWLDTYPELQPSLDKYGQALDILDGAFIELCRNIEKLYKK